MYKPKLARLTQFIPEKLRTDMTRRAFNDAVNNIEVPAVEFFKSIQTYLMLSGSEKGYNPYLFYARYGHILKKFKDIHKGKRCFIIGNGPSIRQQDLTKLRDEITFVVNWFVLHEQYHEINPTYYCISTTGFFRETPEDIPVTEANNRLHRLLREKTINATKFLNYHVKPTVKNRNLLPGHQVYYLNDAFLLDVEKRGLSQDVARIVYHGQTVIIDFCLQLALYMGFSEVYLLGCDCNVQYQTSGASVSHFHPDNPVWGIYKKELSPGDDPQKHSDSWSRNAIKAYAKAQETYERRGRKVYNAGVDGRLEVFPRVNYDELF